MFRKDLLRRLEDIFGFEKTTFNDPGDTYEQDTLFVAIENVATRMSRANGGRETARVTGRLVVFSQGDRLPYGFFMKALERADGDLKKPLFFSDEIDVTESPARLINLHERQISFVFLYDSQYDPNQGQLTSVEFC